MTGNFISYEYVCLSLSHVTRFSVSLSSAGHVTSVHYPAHERHTTQALKKTIASLLSFEQVCHTNYTCTILSKYTSYSTACCFSLDNKSIEPANGIVVLV